MTDEPASSQFPGNKVQDLMEDAVPDLRISDHAAKTVCFLFTRFKLRFDQGNQQSALFNKWPDGRKNNPQGDE